MTTDLSGQQMALPAWIGDRCKPQGFVNGLYTILRHAIRADAR